MMQLLEYYRAGGPVMHFILVVAMAGWPCSSSGST